MKTDKKTTSPSSALGFYHKISNLRADSWNNLKNVLKKLNNSKDEKAIKKFVKSAEVYLSRLEIIED